MRTHTNADINLKILVTLSACLACNEGFFSVPVKIRKNNIAASYVEKEIDYCKINPSFIPRMM